LGRDGDRRVLRHPPGVDAEEHPGAAPAALLLDVEQGSVTGEHRAREWALLEDQGNRPRRIVSLLFIGADGVALLEKLYADRQTSPACICVIQAPPSMGGFNWTSFENKDGPLFQSLSGSSAGLPRFLLYGGSGDPEWYKTSCWPAYRLRLAWPLMRMRNWRREGGLSLWERTA